MKALGIKPLDIRLPGWQRISKGLAGSAGYQDESLRRVGLRLALQTIALLFVMIVTLELVTYFITHQRLQGQLVDDLKTRATQADPSVCPVFHLHCGPVGGRLGTGAAGQPQPSGQGSGFPHTGQGGRPVANGQGGPPPGGRGPFGPSSFTPLSGPTVVSAAYVNAQLLLVHADGPVGHVLLGPQAVTQVFRTTAASCCTVSHYKGQDYLLYTAPIWSGGKVVGAVQTSISEDQYEGTMRFLLQALLVVAILGLAFSSGIAAVLVRRSLQPIRVAMQRQRDFVADAAHELRTPLAIMRTVGEIGMDNPSPDDLQGTVAQMLSENQHLTRLVEDLSLLARADTDAVSIERSPVDLSALVANTAAEIEPLAGEKGISLQAEIQEDLNVAGDVLRLRQLLLILLDNALRHTPDGGRVSVNLSRLDGRVRLRVADTGPGIAPQDLPHIFDRFYRSDKSRTGEGSGLGLAIARWIVEAHGGHVEAGNAPPHGAVFTVTLPITRNPILG